MDASSRVSPLRQRMIDDMRMRKLSEKTQTSYLRAVRGSLPSSRPRQIPRALRTAALPVAHGRTGHVANHAQRDDLRFEVLLRRHAGPW